MPPLLKLGPTRNRWIAPQLENPGDTPPQAAEEARHTLNTPRKKCIRTGLPLALNRAVVRFF